MSILGYDITTLRCYQYSSFSCPNPARAPGISLPMRHIRGRKSVQRLRPCVRFLRKKKESLPRNRFPCHCPATLPTPTVSRPAIVRVSLPNLSGCVRDSSPHNPIVRWQRASPASRLPYRVSHTMRRACLLINHDCPVFPASDRALRC